MSRSDLPKIELPSPGRLGERPETDSRPTSMPPSRDGGFEEEGVLIDRMLAGDERAFEEFADGYFPGLYRFALRVLGGDEDLATELVQATVCKMVPKLDSFRRESSLFTWLCACCRNEIRMHFRAQGRRPTQIEIEDPAIQHFPGLQSSGPDEEVLRQESSGLVHRTLDDLPPHYARALEWKYIDKLAVVEIARRLDLSPKAAESLLTRARTAFRISHDRLTSALEAPSTSEDPAPLEPRHDGGRQGGSQ